MDEFSSNSALKKIPNFREGELAKSKQTLEGLAAEQSQLKVNLEKIEALEDKIKTEMETLKTKMINMNDELNVFGDLDRLRSEAAEKRQLLESEHLSLGTRKTASVQNANTVQVFDLFWIMHLTIPSWVRYPKERTRIWKNEQKLCSFFCSNVKMYSVHKTSHISRKHY